MDDKGKKMGLRRRRKETRVVFGVDSDVDEPIRDMVKMKGKRNPKKRKAGEGNEGKDIEVGKVGNRSEDLGGMGDTDTLASFKKKLKKPNKKSASGLIDGGVLNTIGAEPSGEKSCAGEVKDEVLAVEKSKEVSGEGFRETIVTSNECLDKNVEDSLSALMLKAQSGSKRKSRNSMGLRQLRKSECLNDEFSPGSDHVLEDQLPEKMTSQSPLEPIPDVEGFDNGLNMISGSSMDMKCDIKNNIRKAEDTCCMFSQNSKLSSVQLIADSVLRCNFNRLSGIQDKLEDSATISFSQQSDSYIKSCPDAILPYQDKVRGQLCEFERGTKPETLGLDHLIDDNAKGSVCMEVKEEQSNQEPTSGNGSSEDDVKISSIKRSCDLGHGVILTPLSAHAIEQVNISNLSDVKAETGGFCHSLAREGSKAVSNSEVPSSDQNVCQNDPKGCYLDNGLLNKSCEGTTDETMKLISGELKGSTAFLSENTVTFNENFFVPEPENLILASVSLQKEEALTSHHALSPESVSRVHKQDITFPESQSKDCKQSGDESDSLMDHALMDKYENSTPMGNYSFHRTKDLSAFSCDIIGDEVADRSSSPSTAPDCTRNCADDMEPVPQPNVIANKLQSERATRNTRKPRQLDMAYEGDADWDFLVHNENIISDNQDEDNNLVIRREKLKLSTMFSDAEIGRSAAASYGLKAQAASPLEKIRFKEVLKRKGGLQMYLECRNHILGRWNKDVSCILPLSGCGVSATPVVDESPECSLVREIYAFLNHFAYINVGIASEKSMSESHPKSDLQVSAEKDLGVKRGAISDLDDGVSFIVGSNPDTLLEGKNTAVHDSEHEVAIDKRDMPHLDLQAIKSSTPTEPEKCDASRGQGEVEDRDSIRIDRLDISNSVSPSKVADGGSVTVLRTEPKTNICHILSDTAGHQSVDPHMQNGSEVSKKIIVIGAGPAGLAAARHLQRQGFRVTILEARGRIGGRVFTDRESLSVPVDLGASIITGVEADVASGRRPDPSTLICSQLGLELTVLDGECPLYDTVTGDKVPADLDEDLESEYNSLLDDIKLLLALKGEHALKMSLEDGLEYILKRRRLVQNKKTCVIGNEVLKDNNSKGEILSPLERRVMDWHFAHLEYGCAAPLNDVSLPYWNQDDIYGGFGGAHCMIKGGYSTVVEALGQGLCIHLNHVVTSITYRTEDVMRNDKLDKVKVSTSNGRDFFGDAVLITVPLGCLKRESIKFAPPLPHWKQLSIQRLGFGVLNKVILEFPEVFWDDSVDYFGATSEETDKRGHCFMFWNVRKTVGAPVLIALLVGRAALDGQDRSSSDHVNHALVVLRKLFGVSVVPDPVASVVTDWGRDPYSYGAYSYVAIGASGEDYDILGSPVENRLFFAGEATCKEHPDTVGGAMMSGLREAVRIMNILTTGIDYTEEVNAMEAAQRCMDSERSEVEDMVKRLQAVQMSNALYEKSLDGHVVTKKDLLQDMFSKAKTTSGRLHLVKELLNFPVRVLKSFAGTKEGLTILNSWILDSLGKDGTQLLRHCVRLLTLVSTDLLAVRVSGIGKTVKEKVCLHTSRDIRAVASQLVNVWIEVFRKQKASIGGLKLLRQSSAIEPSKSKFRPGLGKPPLRTTHGAPPPNNKKVNINQDKMENRTDTKSKVKGLSAGSTGIHDSDMEGKEYAMSEEEQAIFAAEEAARAAEIAAAKAYASSGTRCNTPLQLPKIPSFNKYARREQYTQVDEYDNRMMEIDSRNSKVRDWTADFSAAHIDIESSKRSVDNLSQRSYSNEIACQLNLWEHSADNTAVDSSIFTKAWVDSAGCEGIKDVSAIDRWQSQAAAADAEFYSRTMRIMDEGDSNVNLKPPIKNLDGHANESSASQVTMSKELVENQPRGPEKIKQAVVDFVASLLMPVYKDKKIDKDGYKSIMKKAATKVMEQATYAEKSMTVVEFLDHKRRKKIRAFVDMLVGRHMTSRSAYMLTEVAEHQTVASKVALQL
ncbi:lysine-specific histone demethylase 1 homolog 3-like [Apium graveolens]|uniref:lysine-specific histone demethylase 1 homolog 3-like n=1 Tax=Apium graveolens TaxID=4045 RepID=UPI003D7A6ACD